MTQEEEAEIKQEEMSNVQKLLLDGFIKRYKDKFQETTFCGIPIPKLDTDQLMACLCSQCESIIRQREAFNREREMYKSLRNR